MTRRLSVRLSRFAREALTGAGGADAERTSARVASAIRVYLADGNRAAAGWRYPDFARDAGEPDGEEIPLSLDEEVWTELESGAAREGVSVPRLIEHAVLYCAAEVDAGRITRRILDGLDEGAGPRA